MRSLWFYIAAGLVLVGIGAREAAPVAFGAMVLLTGVTSKLWSRYALKRLLYRRDLPDRRAFVGETVDVGFSLSNLKALPVPWLEIRDTVAEALQPLDTAPRPGGPPETILITRSTALTWYERVRWRHSFRCRRRGFFQFGPVSFHSGDVFGFFPAAATVWTTDRIAVLPRRLSLNDIGLPSLRPFGEAASGSPIFEDQSRMTGIRDYRPGDPLKRIDWKASARHQSLQSRVYDPAATLTMLIAVGVSTLEHSWEGYEPLLLERAISVAGSIATYADAKRYACGLAANCTFPNADRNIWIPPARQDQLAKTLEALSMISPFVLAPLEQVIEHAWTRLPYGATLVIVAGYLPQGLRDYLTWGRGRERRAFLVWVGDREPPDLGPRLQIYDAGSHLRAVERAWQQEHPGATPLDAWSAA